MSTSDPRKRALDQPVSGARVIHPFSAPPSSVSSLLSPRWPLLFLILVWAGKTFVGERWWLTTWLVYLPQPLFLVPSLGLMLLALLLRRWRILAAQIVVAMLGIGLLFSGAYRLSPPPQRGDVRVMTWNVMGLQGNPEGVLITVRQQAPDLLLLQEVRRVRGSDPVAWLLQRLPGWRAVRGGDVAIVSPHLLASGRRFALEAPTLGRVAVQASAQVRGKVVEVATVHFNTGVSRISHGRAWNHPRQSMTEGAAARREQGDRLATIVQQMGRPLVVGGDFNSPPDSYACRRMAGQLQSAFAAGGSGFGWSFPSNRPLLRIDHLFASADLKVLDCRVLPTSASDHCPLVADLVFVGRKA